jgi:PRTRC genetic system protein D
MHDIAIDVGSGITKVCGDNKKTSFASLSGQAVPGGFDLDEVAGAVISFRRKTFVVGDLAARVVPPEKLANTRDDLWYASDEYLALMYAALAKVLPEGYNGKIRLCTGLPQALYNEHKEALVKRLASKHTFRIDGVKYVVHLRTEDVFIMPQVIGLFLSRLIRDKSLQIQKVALLDVGTYTSDWTMVEGLGTIQWASGGIAVGVSNVVQRVSDHLREVHNAQCTEAAVARGVQFGSLIIRQKRVDLSEQIRAAVLDSAAPMVDAVELAWRGAKDAKIIVGGGGGKLFVPAIRSRMPHATVIEDDEPIYSIVDGYQTYLDQRREQASKDAA